MSKHLVRFVLLSTLIGLPSLVDAAILRYVSRALDSSADPAARIPQLIIADTAAECPSSDVGDGDVCYGKDTDTHLLRQNAAWVTVTITTHTHTLVGDVDGDVGTTDLDEAAVEAEIESVVDLADLQGTLTVGKGGTGAAPGAGDQVLVSDTTTSATWKAVPDCNTENMLTYTASTNTWGCEADSTGVGGGDAIRVEDGDNLDTFTAATDPDFIDDGDINFALDTAPTPDAIRANIRADAVALTTDTTGNYAAGDAEAGAALTGDSATAFFSAGTIEDARIDGGAEADEVTLVGDVDGAANANDIDETAVETELESVLDLDQLQGTITDAQIADAAVDGGTGGEIADASITRADLAANLITNQYAFTLYDPDGLTLGDDIPSIIPNRARAVTLTEVWCESSDGTAVINLQRDDGSAANILSSNCTCGSSGTACTIDTAEDNVADGDNIDFVFVSETATVRVNVQITYTVD